MIRPWARSQRRVIICRRSMSAQLRNKREGAALAVLGRPRRQPHEAASEVYLRPAERKHFGATPLPGDEHELHRVGEVRGQMPVDVGEALTRVVLE
jgi:hypothetical protein